MVGPRSSAVARRCAHAKRPTSPTTAITQPTCGYARCRLSATRSASDRSPRSPRTARGYTKADGTRRCSRNAAPPTHPCRALRHCRNARPASPRATRNAGCSSFRRARCRRDYTSPETKSRGLARRRSGSRSAQRPNRGTRRRGETRGIAACARSTRGSAAPCRDDDTTQDTSHESSLRELTEVAPRSESRRRRSPRRHLRARSSNTTRPSRSSRRVA